MNKVSKKEIIPEHIIEKIVYISEDGREFSSESSCERHEHLLALKTELQDKKAGEFEFNYTIYSIYNITDLKDFRRTLWLILGKGEAIHSKKSLLDAYEKYYCGEGKYFISRHESEYCSSYLQVYSEASIISELDKRISPLGYKILKIPEIKIDNI